MTCRRSPPNNMKSTTERRICGTNSAKVNFHHLMAGSQYDRRQLRYCSFVPAVGRNYHGLVWDNAMVLWS